MNHHAVSPNAHPDDRRKVGETFKALADETRIRLVLHLLDGERNVGALVEALGAPQSTVSRHLAVLRHADVVATRRDGTSVYYRLADAHLGDLVRQAFAHAEHRRLRLPDHEDDAPTRAGVSAADGEAASS